MNIPSPKFSGEWGQIGCIAIILLLILPFVVQAMFPFLLIGGIGFFLYRLFIYETQTGNVTRWFERDKKPKKEGNTQTLDYDERKGLYVPKDDLLQQMKDKIDKLELDNRQMRESQKEKITLAIKQQTEQINTNQKKQILDNIFGDSPDNYARSDEFEKQDFQAKVKKKEGELEIREIKQNVNEQLFEQERKIYDFADEAKEERFEIRAELREGFVQVDARFMKIEGDFADFKGYVGEKFSHLELHFLKEITHLKEFIGNVRLEFKQEQTEIKLQFGKEILRIDRQQMGIVDRMQKYENQVRAFSIDMVKLKNEAEIFAIRGEDLLNKANNVYQSHKADMQVASNQLNMGLQKMALDNQSFSNTVASAKLKLDEISNDQYLALKDMAFERIGINMLRQEHDQRAALEQEKMNGLIQEQRHIEGKIKEELSRGREVGALQHQLQMARENLSYTSHRADLMRQESNIMRRLSR